MFRFDGGHAIIVAEPPVAIRAAHARRVMSAATRAPGMIHHADQLVLLPRKRGRNARRDFLPTGSKAFPHDDQMFGPFGDHHGFYPTLSPVVFAGVARGLYVFRHAHVMEGLRQIPILRYFET